MACIWTILSLVFLIAHLLHHLLGPKNNKRLPPGPRGLPILGHFHLLSPNPHHDLRALARKHGPIMGLRFGSIPTVVITSPSAAELILKTHDHVFASRPRNAAAKYIGYEQRNLVSGPYGPYWRNMRKLVTLELLNSDRVAHFQPMRNAEIARAIESIKRASLIGKPVDLSKRISGLSGDMNCMMVFGRKYSDLEEIGFKSVIGETMELAARFNLADYFPYIGALDLQGINRRLKHLSKIFDGIIEKIIHDHDANKENEYFVDTMMSILQCGNAGFEFGRLHVKAILLVLNSHLCFFFLKYGKIYGISILCIFFKNNNCFIKKYDKVVCRQFSPKN